jgi:thiamine-phosphate pyrophosphorylase
VSLPDPPLLVVTDRSQTGRGLSDIVAAACAAGCRWISVREKDLAAADQIVLARMLLRVAHAGGARLTLHGDIGVAKAAGVDGVHLPAGADAAQARALLGDAALIGLSVHGTAQLRHAAAADYVIAGPACETASKPGYGPALGTEGVAAFVLAAPVPVLAIGGIAADNLAPFLQAGAAGVAVMGGVMRASDPGEEVWALLRAMARARA